MATLDDLWMDLLSDYEGTLNDRLYAWLADGGGGGGGGTGEVTSVNGKKGNVNLTLTDIPNGAARLAMTPAQQAKLEGIAAGATANSSDATLLSRANHTGEQAQSTITGLVSALASKLGRVFARTDSDTEPWLKTEFTGIIDSEDQNTVEHYVNGTLTAGTNEWGALRGWRAPFADALVRAILPNGVPIDGAIDKSGCIEIVDRRSASPVSVVYRRRWNGTLVRNDIDMIDAHYYRADAGDPLPANLPVGTIVFTPVD